MVIRGKKGQFFFIATLIIVTILLSLTNTYNFVSTAKEDTSYKFVSKDLKFESIQLVNNGFYNTQSFHEINQNILNLTSLYSINYQAYNITVVTGLEGNDDSFNQYSFKKGVMYNSSKVSVLNNQIYLNLYTGLFNFNVSKGFNVHVITFGENENGRFVSHA